MKFAPAEAAAGIRWLSVAQVPGQRPLTYLLLALVTAEVAILLVRTDAMNGLKMGSAKSAPSCRVSIPRPT